MPRDPIPPAPTPPANPPSAAAEPGPREALASPHAASPEVVLAALGSGPRGLDDAEAARRLAEQGPNELPQAERSLWRMWWRQFDDVLVWILLAALGVSLALPLLTGEVAPVDFADAAIILAIILVNAALGFFQEHRAERAMEGLQALTAPESRVRRAGQDRLLPSRELVPGDLVVLDAGDRVSADGRLLRAAELALSEASLTGESDAVEKSAAAVPADRPLAERGSMVYSGTLVTRGAGLYAVTATGEDTEIGEIAGLVARAEIPETPLVRRMRRLGQVIGVVVVFLGLVVVAIGLARGLPWDEILLVAVSLAVSAVPEGLPAVVTVTMAMGVRRMVEKQAIVRRLDALETLGSVTAIASDKTGTITENRMAVVAHWAPREEPEALRALARAGASCNLARLPDLGDPTELGLLGFARELGVEREPIDELVEPFSSERRAMSSRHGDTIYTKGAPDALLARLPDDPAAPALREAAAALAARGLRVLAAAGGPPRRQRLLGLYGLEDPARRSVPDAIREAGAAGIRTIMITGDGPETARAIAEQVGIAGELVTGAALDERAPAERARLIARAAIFARVSPAHKLEILAALQDEGEIVAMTGDGVNDAPALKGAHVGVAMGLVGTEVARESASIVLADDDFGTIVAAIREGRRIYDNIRKFVVFLLRANFDELMMIVAALLLGLPLPYLPVHILWINLMTDSLPALALGVEPAEADVMRRPPRPPEEGLLQGEWPRLLLTAVYAFGLAFGLYLWLLDAGVPIDEARSLTLTTAILFELFLALNARSRRPIWEIGLRSNPAMLWACAVPLALHAAVLYTPLAGPFRLVPLSAGEWALSFGLCLASFLLFEVAKLVGPTYGRHRAPRAATSDGP